MENVTESNRLIAGFMGYKQRENGGLFWGNEGLGGLYDADFKYHSSWDWLMPVIARISETENPFEDSALHVTFHKHAHAVLSAPIGYAKQADVYQKAVDFIKWYNTQKA